MAHKGKHNYAEYDEMPDPSGNAKQGKRRDKICKKNCAITPSWPIADGNPLTEEQSTAGVLKGVAQYTLVANC